MEKLASIVISSTDDVFGEEMILSETTSPIAAWSAGDDLIHRFSQGSIWLQELDTGADGSNGGRYSVNGADKSLFYLTDTDKLAVTDWSTLNLFFEDPVVVDPGPVDVFAVPEHNRGFDVVYAEGQKIYRRRKSGDDWGAQTELVSETSDITSVSYDFNEGYRLLAYTTADNRLEFHALSGYGTPPSIAVGDTAANVVLRLSNTYDFDLLYEKGTGYARSIEHVFRDGSTISSSTVASSSDHHNPDIDVEEDGTAHAVWISDGYLNYRSKSSPWVGLSDAYYVDSADSDSQPKVVVSGGYPRIIYKKNGYAWYNGLLPGDDDFAGVFYVSAWNSTKFVETSNTSVTSATVRNRLSQRVRLSQEEVAIGKVAVNLERHLADDDVSFSLVLELHYANSNGTPGTLIDTATVSSTAVDEAAWYQFVFNTPEEDTPDAGYCLVMYQSGGDENNFITWNHTFVIGESDAYFSRDGSTWNLEKDVVRSVRVQSDFDAYSRIINSDPSQITYQLVSPPADAADGEQSDTELADGEFDNTVLTDYEVDPAYPGYYPAPGDTVKAVVLDQKNLHVTFVVDSSGSSGWNDPFGLRTATMREMIDRLGTTFPGQVTYDVVRCGGRELGLISPNFSKRVRGVVVSVTDVSNITGFDSDGNPLTADNVQEYLGTGVVAYGFKDLKGGGSPYVVYGFNLGWKEVVYTDVSSRWRDLWATGSPANSVSGNGPDGAETLNITVADTDKDASRYFIAGLASEFTTNLSSDVAVGATNYPVVNSSGFAVDDQVNVVDRNSFEAQRFVTGVNDSPDSVDVEQTGLIAHDTDDGALLEKFDAAKAELNWEQTDAFEFFVLDSQSRGKVKFFVQTVNGAHIEWEFEPLVEWEFFSLYWTDETALFEIDAVDANGESLPDGTLVEWYVDKQPNLELQEEEENKQEDILLTRDAAVGTTLIYVSEEDISKFSRNDEIDIIDIDRNPEGFVDSGTKTYVTTVVSEVDEDLARLTISDPMPSTYLVSKQASILLPATQEGDLDIQLVTPLPIFANLVDITPIYSGSQLPEGLFSDFDPPQVDPTADPDSYSDDPSRVRRITASVLTNDGWAAVRLGPITEDSFLEPEIKDSLTKSLFNISDREQVRLDALAALEKGEETGEEDLAVAEPEEEEEEEQTSHFDGVPDFVMKHRTFVSNGYTSTTMKSFPTEVTETELAGREYLARQYAINPVMTIFDDGGDELAIILMEETEVYFALPVTIANEVQDTVFYRQCPVSSEGEGISYVDREVAGVYAASGNTVTIDYDVNYKDFPTDGTVLVNIYDARRTQDTRWATDDELGDIDGCGDEENLEGGTMVLSSGEADDAYEASIENALLAQDLLGDEDENPASYTLDVVNGNVSITLPALNRIALLEVHVIFQVPDSDQRVVNVQTVYYKNPIVITYTGPASGSADGESRYNLSATVSWMELYPVHDGTIVNFSSGGTPMSPSVSQTVSGLAEGVILGPHEPIVVENNFGSLRDEDGTVSEGLSINTSFRGFYSEIDAEIEWNAETPPGNFYFYASGRNTNPDSSYNGSDNLWADGKDYISMNGDLAASSNRGFPFIDEVAPNLIEDRMGVVYSGGITVSTRLPRWSDEVPPEGPFERGDFGEEGWVHNKCYVNRFIGRPPKRESSEEQPPPCASPECIEVNLFTRSREFNVTGIGIESDTVSFLQQTLSGGEAKIPKPRIYPIEPLGICVSMEPKDRGEYQERTWPEVPPCESPKSPGYSAENYPIKRDGSATYFIVAEVSWRDLVIKEQQGNPLPIVTFQAGTTTTTEAGDIEFTPFEDPDDFPLDASTKQVDHLRTTYDHDHYHEVVIDDDSNKGKTVSTVTYTKGKTIEDHVHEINLELDAADIIDNAVSTDEEGNTIDHNHDLRAVAVIGGGPAKDQSMDLAVQGVVTYDNGRIQADGTRVERTLDNYAFAQISVGEGEEDVQVGFNLEIIPVGKQFVDGAIVDAWFTALNASEDGNTVLYHATQTLADGSTVPVPDGTRIFTTFRFYEAEDEEEESDVIIIGGDDDAPRNYAVAGIEAKLGDIPDEVSASKKVLVTSKIQWFPDVSEAPVMRFPTDDSQYLEDAIDSITELGSSQINDALALAARRMITFEDELKDSSKVIMLISDGGENLSELSYEQATTEVNAVSSDGVAIFAVKLANTELYDDLVMKKLSGDTEGEYAKVGNVPVSAAATSEDVVDTLLTSESLDVLFGRYMNTVDLGEEVLFDELRFLSVDVSGTSFFFRIRFSDDLKNWTSWTNVGEGPDYTISGDVVARYMQYEASLFGNPDDFESPVFLGVQYDFYRPRGYTLFFQPFSIDEGRQGYVGEIIFAHRGTIPDTSTVKYGVTHSISTDFDDYGSHWQPYMQDGTGGIVLSRVNESLTTTDNRNYTAVNGPWHSSYEAKVYEVSSLSPYGSLVDTSRYSLDNTTGTIAFSQAQPADSVFTITLGLKPFFRIGVDIVNRGPESVVLDYVGSMYRTVDRAEIAPGDHRPVTSIVGTDLLELDLTSSGTWSPELSVYNTEFGEDTDVLVDVAVVDDIFYVLGWDGTSAFIQTLAENLTAIRRVSMTDIAVQPTSFSYMDGAWYVAYEDSDGDAYVSRRDTDFEFVSTLDVSESSYTGVIRSKGDRWYVPAENAALKYSRSFNFRESISVGADILPMLTNSGDNLVSPSVWRDVVFTISLDGELLEAYNVSFAESATNIELASDKLYIVFPTHFRRYGTG